MNIDYSVYSNDERAVLVFSGGQVEWVNDACRAVSEGLELFGYELEYIVGEELAELIASFDGMGSLSFSGFNFCGQRGYLEVDRSPDRIVLFFSPAYGQEEREAMRGYRQYAERLESQRSARFGQTGGAGAYAEQLPADFEAISRTEIQNMRMLRRIEQVRLLERCFEPEPISGELGDVTALCIDTLSRCAELLGDRKRQVILRSTNAKKLERVFNSDELERMFSCLLTGALALCGDEPVEVSVSVSEQGTLRVDLTSSAEGFSDAGISKTMRLPRETDNFVSTGRGLELLLASEIASRYFGKLQFYRSDGVGRLSAFISPSFYGMEYDLFSAIDVASSLYPQYLIELSEML